MTTLCGRCGQSPCSCGEIEPAAHHWARATGELLDKMAVRVGIKRSEGEPDATFRARVQLSVIFGYRYNTGIMAGAMLDKAGQRRGPSGRRIPGESDEDYRVRLAMMSPNGQKLMEDMQHENAKQKTLGR